MVLAFRGGWDRMPGRNATSVLRPPAGVKKYDVSKNARTQISIPLQPVYFAFLYSPHPTRTPKVSVPGLNFVNSASEIWTTRKSTLQ